jgi:hypothetical protein
MPVVGSPEDLALSGWDGAPADGPVFALGDTDGDVRFAATGNGRLIAPAGDRLWRRAPWPVRDALFELPPADDPSAVLVVGQEAPEWATVAPRLTLEALQAAAVVVLTDGPRLAMCVLAARRVLVTDDTGPTFGLQSGIEFLGASTPDQAMERANTARRHPRATASLKAMGARAAREHRASLVYPRLTADLEAAGG